MVLFSTMSEATRLPFSFVCLRNGTFVLVVKVISFSFFFVSYIIIALFIYLFYLFHTEHVQQGNAKAISSTILAAHPHLETY